jgi:hypothetical protein
MYNSRRTFLSVAASVAAAAATGAAQSQMPNSSMPGRVPPYGPNPASRRPFGAEPPEPAPRSNPREILRANQEDIKKDVARLTQLVSELQKGLDESDTKDVLSLEVIHKTEEIEKLAKQIRGLIRS